MEEKREKLISYGIKNVAIGYIFIYFNINIGVMDILPGWAGYLIILSALPVLAQKEKSAILLKSFGIFMTVVYVAKWILDIFGNFNLPFDFKFEIVDIFISIIQVYFHFQLITNIADLSPSGKRRKRLLVLRAVNAISVALINLIAILDGLIYFSLAAGILSLAMCIWISFELISLSKEIKKLEEIGEYY